MAPVSPAGSPPLGYSAARGGPAADLPQPPGSKQVTVADDRHHRTPGSFKHGEQRSQSCSNLHGSAAWTAATATKSGGSGTYGSPGRPGLARTKSATAVALPPIKVKKQPLRFEDLYSIAKVRVSKKAAQVRFNGANPAALSSNSRELPTLPHTAKADLAASRAARKELMMIRQASEKEQREAEWASQALGEIFGEDSSDGSRTPDSNSRGGTAGEPIKVRRNSIAMRRMNSHRSLRGDENFESNFSRRASLTREGDNQLLGDNARRFSFASWAGFEGAPGNDLPEILNRLAMQEEGFSDRELTRLKLAFNRFKVPGSADLHIDDVPDLLGYLGRVLTSRDKVMPLLKDLTSYDYIDFEEFVEFMTNFNLMEREAFQDIFDEFDADMSGEISVQELRAITGALGFMPLRKMIMEALLLVDVDSNGQLNFDEFVTFLTVYRHAEGFTREEVKELKESYDKFAVREKGEILLPPENLSDCLVRVFGLQVSDYATEVGALLASGQGLQKSSLATNDAGEPECLSFAEFLIFGRKVREDQLKKMREDYAALGWGTDGVDDGKKDKLLAKEQAAENAEFARADKNKNGKISEDELRAALKHHYGYTPLRCVLLEVFEETLDDPWETGYELSFNEFFDFMLVLRHRDGFLRQEVAEFRSLFERFDDSNTGEINALELSDLMRFLGYTASLDLMRGLVVKVDKNESGQLDFNEFLHLMRLYREDELKRIKVVFERSMDRNSGKMAGKYLMQCMQDMGYDQQELLTLYGDQLKEKQAAELDFDQLVEEMDQCRGAKVMKQRKKAGFGNEELDNFKLLFQGFDKDHNGHIDNSELIELLKFFNWQPRSKEGQTVLMEKLDVARSRAKEAGIQDVGEYGSPNIKFWVFVQLARMLKREIEQQEEIEVAAVVKELKLSEKEADQFRNIFQSAIMREKDKAKEAGGQAIAFVPEYGLKGEGVRTLIRSLGVQLTTRVDDKLSVKLVSLEEDRVLTFIGFLRLMMWMVETNFAGINDAAAKYAH